MYAKLVLKKKVDWSTLKKLRNKTILKITRIPKPDVPFAIMKMLSKVKLEKSFLLNKILVLLDTSNLDEHTYEEDMYSFHSNNEDIAMEKSRSILHVRVDQKDNLLRSLLHYQTLMKNAWKIRRMRM